MESLTKRHGFWQNGTAPGLNPLGLKFLLFLTSIFWLGLIAAAWSEASESGEMSDSVSHESKNDEYNFSWLDPEKKIYVLQNRKYVKTGHPIVSVMGGGSMSNPYRNILSVDGRFAYYMSEWLGVEVFYTNFLSAPNTTIQALAIASPNALPSVREIRSQMGGMIHFVPWYAKINVFNSILYFDWYFGAGLASLSSFVDTNTVASSPANFVQQTLPGLCLSTGNEYYLSQSFIFRWDVMGTFYSAPINQLTGRTSIFSNVNFAMGLGWRI